MKYPYVIVLAHEEDDEIVCFTYNNMTAEEAEKAAEEEFRLEDPSLEDEERPEVYLDYIYASDTPIVALVE